MYNYKKIVLPNGKIMDEHKNGYTNKELSIKYKISKSRMSMILNNKDWFI